MNRQLDMKTGPQVLLHQHGAENHLTQSIQQCGEEKNEDIFYRVSFSVDHPSKVKFAQSYIINREVFPDELQYWGDEFKACWQRLNKVEWSTFSGAGLCVMRVNAERASMNGSIASEFMY